MRIPRWPGPKHRLFRYTFRLLWGRIAVAGGLLLCIGALTTAVTASLTRPASVRDFDRQVLELDLADGDNELDVLRLLDRWGMLLEQIVIADDYIEGLKIPLLETPPEISWKVFKKILAMNDIAIVEQQVTPDQFLIKAYRPRICMSNDCPPYRWYVSPAIPDGPGRVTAIIPIRGSLDAEVSALIQERLSLEKARGTKVETLDEPAVVIIVGDRAETMRYSELIRSLAGGAH